MILLLLGCESGSVIPMPGELTGFWRNSAEAYQDSYLVLTALEVRFGRDGEAASSHEISEVRKIGDPTEQAYRITYLSTEGREYWLSVQYQPASGTLRLINQPQWVWERTQLD